MSEFLPMFLITLVVFGLFFLCMSVGYIFQNKPLKGSCGGVAKLMGNDSCEFCGGDPNKCDTLNDTLSDSTKKAVLGKKI